jgi:ABC-type transport system involved in cytochrome bd biosynthesis fused ATPase/permease subunit
VNAFSGRRYLREFLPAMAGYTLSVPISITLLLTAKLSPAVKVLVALLPVLPMVLVVWAILRNLQRLDELQQRIQTQAICVASTLVGMLTFALGFLQNARLLPSPPWVMLWVLPVMIWVWGVATAVIARRYRGE